MVLKWTSWWRGEDLNLRPSGYEPWIERLPTNSPVNRVSLNYPSSWDDQQYDTLSSEYLDDTRI